MSILKRLLGGISDAPASHLEDKWGCRLDSARPVADEERREIVKGIEGLGPWFHNYEIASGVWTNSSGRAPGIEYPLGRWRLVEPLLPDVKGKACLDIACSSGFFALKLKELGAAYVLGIDSGEQPQAIDQARFAASTLGLDVDFRVLSAYDVASLQRQFDIVLFMGLFYHLRHPLLALEAARSVCAGTMIFQTITTKHGNKLPGVPPGPSVSLHSSTIEDAEYPSLRFVEGGLDGDTSCWFTPNVTGVAAMLRSCGFQLDTATFANDHDIIVRCN